MICDYFILRSQKCHASGPVQLRLIWSRVTQPPSFTTPFATDAFYHEDIKWGSYSFNHTNFKIKDQSHYNLRYNCLFSRPLIKSVYKGTESLWFIGPKIWDILPDATDLNSFKVVLKKWRPVDCPCKICKVYIANVCFL